MSDLEKARKAATAHFTVSPTNSDTKPIVETLLEWAFADDSYTLQQVIEWQLESISCAGCHAPGGLIYNHEIAAKFADWWGDIDDALAAYRDATGESFAPETCGALVWFAVEWYAHDLASFLRSEFEV